MSRPIDSFDGDYEWLSNFYPVKVWLDGLEYSSVEHAYQAAKSLDVNERLKIQSATSAANAKKLGRQVTMRADWGSYKFEVMLLLLEQKFTLYKDLRDRLKKTGSRELIEGNWWGDTIWGVCKGKGDNHLGKLLMKVRSALN